MRQCWAGWGAFLDEAIRFSSRLSRYSMLAFDEMAMMPLLLHPIPYQGHVQPTDFKPRSVQDTDATAVAVWMQRAGLQRMGQEVCHAAMALRAKHRAFHPVATILKG